MLFKVTEQTKHGLIHEDDNGMMIMIMIYLHAKFRMSSPNSSLVIRIKPKTRENIHVPTALTY
jgi:hypothetical protein